jgi:hypothetical protein
MNSRRFIVGSEVQRRHRIASRQPVKEDAPHVRFGSKADMRIPKRIFLFAVIPNIGGEFPFAPDLFPHDKIFP